MAVYTQPIQWRSTLQDADILNEQFRDNLNALADPARDDFEFGLDTNDTTTATTFEAVGNVDTLSLTTYGGAIWVGFSAAVSINNGTDVVFFDVTIDGKRIGEIINLADQGICGVQNPDGASAGRAVMAQANIWVEGIEAGAHTLVLHWMTRNGNTATIQNGTGDDIRTQFWAVECG